MLLIELLAEREGFEPPVPLGTAVFKTAVIDHSTISPKVVYGRKRGFAGAKVGKKLKRKEKKGRFFSKDVVFLDLECLKGLQKLSKVPRLEAELPHKSPDARLDARNEYCERAN